MNGERKAKPMGPIPAGYAADASAMLLIGGERADALVERAGDTPLFVYDTALIGARIAHLRAALPAEIDIHYAIKANSHPALLRYMAGQVGGFDIASGGELALAMAAGMAADAISFAGPGKRDDELTAAIRAGVTLNLESEGEAARALNIAEKLGVRPRLAVRVNPDFDLKGSGMRMGGGAKAFGVDADRVPALIRRILDAGADWQGLHIFAGSQALDAASIAETQAATLALADDISAHVGAVPPLVNIGGGLGVPYFPGDVPVDVAHVGQELGRSLSQSALAQNGTTRFAMELGRYLVAEAGVYLTRIVDIKQSHGETFAMVDGGLHHQLAASGNFGTVVRRNYPLAIANHFGAPASHIVHIAGCLCTPLDKLGDAVLLPEASVGDLVAIFLAGAYGASASPAAFLGHPAARELVLGA